MRHSNVPMFMGLFEQCIQFQREGKKYFLGHFLATFEVLKPAATLTGSPREATAVPGPDAGARVEGRSP